MAVGQGRQFVGDWKARSIVRRDYRHDPDPQIREVTRFGKKNTGKWCRGKIGTPHDYDFVKFWGFLDFWIGSYADYECINCGKKTYVELQKEEIEAAS